MGGFGGVVGGFGGVVEQCLFSVSGVVVPKRTLDVEMRGMGTTLRPCQARPHACKYGKS